MLVPLLKKNKKTINYLLTIATQVNIITAVFYGIGITSSVAIKPLLHDLKEWTCTFLWLATYCYKLNILILKTGLDT